MQSTYDPKSIEHGFDRWKLHKPANFELIQVKPNWHNSLEVVGYKSNIGGSHYEYTPFIEFIVRAWQHPEEPFFLCLDEMNLAPVEQYFAEFLSAIETRSIENGEYITDPIVKPFDSFNTIDDEGNIIDNLGERMIAKLLGPIDDNDEAKKNLAKHLRIKGLTLPKNLIVIGTVNMDETTFSFSRKVLDRAMSMQMNDIDFEAFFNGSSENDIAEMDDDTKKLLIDRAIKGIEAPNNDEDEVKKYLKSINDVLEDTPFKLGYRAINEALLFVSAANAFDPDIETIQALDQFTMMKILSRIEGDKLSLGNVLNRLEDVINENFVASNKKLKRMAQTLEVSQFVSYWT